MEALTRYLKSHVKWKRQCYLSLLLESCIYKVLLPSGGEQHEVLLFGSTKEGILQAPH